MWDRRSQTIRVELSLVVFVEPCVPVRLNVSTAQKARILTFYEDAAFDTGLPTLHSGVSLLVDLCLPLFTFMQANNTHVACNGVRHRLCIEQCRSETHVPISSESQRPQSTHEALRSAIQSYDNCYGAKSTWYPRVREWPSAHWTQRLLQRLGHCRASSGI